MDHRGDLRIRHQQAARTSWFKQNCANKCTNCINSYPGMPIELRLDKPSLGFGNAERVRSLVGCFNVITCHSSWSRDVYAESKRCQEIGDQALKLIRTQH